MNVNPHLQYLLQQQVGQNSNQSPQLSHLQLQQQQQAQAAQTLQRQQLLNHLQQTQQQLQQQPQGLSQGLNQGLNQQIGNTSGPLQNTTTSNPLLAALNGSTFQPQQQTQQTQSQGGAPQPQLQQLQQLQHQQQLQQQLQQQQQQQQQQQLQFQPAAPAQSYLPQVPIIKEVWIHNLEHEFQSLRTFISDKSSSIYITIHQEIPGIVARPVGTFKSSSDYHFQTLRSNLDLLNMIQLSLCVTKLKKNSSIEVLPTVIWQFNFLYDLNTEMFNEEHLSMLSQTSQINFPLHVAQGIPHLNFAELIIESGLLLDQSINWISYHGGYDLGFLIALLLNDSLPVDEKEFYWWCSKYFPNFYDLKFMGGQLVKGNNGTNSIGNNNGNNNNSNNSNNSNNNMNNNNNSNSNNGGNNSNSNNNNNGSNGNNSADEKSSTKPSIEYLAEELHLLPISPIVRQYFALQLQQQAAQTTQQASQQMTSTLHAYLAMECFKELLRISNVGDPNLLLAPFKGAIWGLSGNTTSLTAATANAAAAAVSGMNLANGNHLGGEFESKGSLTHFGRP